ncbi:Vegetative incompatibility protein [Drechslerella dactyloides]|uniref:Vegetative incompatibility protein n=1 Tax=Drechslerella dactyloides TaxID=74499 RepID=A0AAD6IUG2_DREDA|nr:Vegetative incompatibility protein [Drechslerella dactyloides]
MTTDLCQISGDIRSNGGNIFVGKTAISGTNITFHRSSPDELYQCLQHLRQTDPLTDIERIRSESHKGVPLTGSYEWILRNAAFEDWEASGSGILWIRGDPGKGKTMIMIALIDQYSRKRFKRNLEDAAPISPTTAHFICESQDQYHNNAISVLRGLLFMILDRRPELLRYLQDAFKSAGPRLFEDGTVDLFQTLRRIFLEILDDDRLGQICFFLDALDECETGLDLLLDLITSTAANPNVRWAVTSRKQENILRSLNPKCLKIDLEDNSSYVQKAIELYIDEKIEALDYGPSTSSTVSTYLKEKSEGTFLWVHLVFKMLAEVPEWDVLIELEQAPPGLDAFYERMFQQVSKRRDATLYYQVLATADFRVRFWNPEKGLCVKTWDIKADSAAEQFANAIPDLITMEKTIKFRILRTEEI